MIKQILFFLVSISLAAKDSPSIIVIEEDDLGYAEMSFMGLVDDFSTPNIDRLAKGGMRFTNAYSTAPICNAARIAIMTGAYQHRQGQHWYGGPGLHNPESSTIAETLKEQGYTNGLIGKFHHGASDKIGKRGFPLNHGFDTFFGFSGGTKHFLHHDSKYKDRNFHEGPTYVQDNKENVEGFTTEIFGQRARDFISQNDENKFYLHLSFNVVHNFTHQLPESYLKEKGLEGFADAESKKECWSWRKKIGYPAHTEGRDYYLGQLYFMDREIGLLLNQLDKLELTEKTAVFFISYNGGSLVTYANNGPLKGGKYTLFEGGTRVPLIVRIPENSLDGRLSSEMDLYPTICQLAGAEIPSNTDGKILLSKDTNEFLFWDTKREVSVRFGKWKYLVIKKTSNSKLQIVETLKGEFLSDVENDLRETSNVLQNYPEVTAKLKQNLKEWQESVK